MEGCMYGWMDEWREGGMEGWRRVDGLRMSGEG